jgi:hypothetical protein
MIRHLFFLIFLQSNFLFSQVEIQNNSLLDPNFPVAYRGYENKLSVKGFENDSTVILVSINDTLRKFGDYYFYRGSKLKTDTLKALKEGKVIAQKIYSLEILREPKIYLGTIRDSLITVEDILNNSELIVSYEPQIAIPCTRILNFDGVILKKGGKKIPLVKENQRTENWTIKKWERKLAKIERKGGTIYNGMNHLNAYQIRLIKKMNSGDMLHIQYGTLSCPSCVNRKININLRLTIK